MSSCRIFPRSQEWSVWRPAPPRQLSGKCRDSDFLAFILCDSFCSASKQKIKAAVRGLYDITTKKVNTLIR